MSQSAFACAATLYPDGSVYDKGETGMTLRDYFAAKAMQGLFSVMGDPIELQRAMKKGGYSTPRAWVAGTAYEMADAMLAAREK